MITNRSRRRFFGAAAAAAAWPVPSRVPGAESAAVRLKPDATDAVRGGQLKIRHASYSMRESTLDQALDMARTLGVKYMTFNDIDVPRTDPAEATRAL